MLDINDEQFEELINQSMDELTPEYIQRLDNVVITYEDEPTPAQRQELKLRGNQTLYGLYQGIPRTQRGNNYNLVIPDKITIFKLPILRDSSSFAQLKEQVKNTLWHEIAHHYGLNHHRIHELESKNRKPHDM
jgi:predicted Zn-dependent protease with MMP-like domain